MTNLQKILRNIGSGLVYQILTLVLGITIPRLVLVNLGSEANGLLNSVNQALVYLVLLEGGVGLTITQALYKPVADREHSDINGIMSAANAFYRHVGTLYFIGMFFVAVAYSLVIKTTYNRFVVFTVVVLSGLPQVINFFFQGKYRTLISVSGRGYILTNMNSVMYIVTSLSKIFLLLHGFDVVAIQAMYCVVSLIQMLFIVWYVHHEFPWLNIRVRPAKEKIGQRKAVFIHQISGFIFNNTDMLILSIFSGLKVTSVYAMYNMFFSMISGFITTLTGSVSFAMGQKYNTDLPSYRRYNNCYETLCITLSFMLFTVLAVFLLPFLKIYTAGVTDISYQNPPVLYFFLAINIVQFGRSAHLKTIEYAGSFKETQPHAVVEMIVNLLVSVIGVIKFGIFGVLAGTIASLTVRMFLMVHYSCRKLLKVNPLRMYRKMLVNIMILLAFLYACSKLTIPSQNYFIMAAFAVPVTIVSVLIYGAAVFVYDRDTVHFVSAYLKNRFHKG